MPYSKNSKSQKRSKSQSKSGGRRRKHTMRKLRRGKKSRKVMRGGDYTKSQIMEGYTKLNQNQKFEFLSKMGPMYSGGDPEVLDYGIGTNAPDAQKAIGLLKEYNVLT